MKLLFLKIIFKDKGPSFFYKLQKYLSKLRGMAVNKYSYHAPTEKSAMFLKHSTIGELGAYNGLGC